MRFSDSSLGSGSSACICACSLAYSHTYNFISIAISSSFGRRYCRSSPFFWFHWVLRRCTSALGSGRSRCVVNTRSYAATCQLVILVSFRPPLVKSQKHLTKIYDPYLETHMLAKGLFNLQCFPLCASKRRHKKKNDVPRDQFTRLVPESRPIR